MDVPRPVGSESALESNRDPKIKEIAMTKVIQFCLPKNSQRPLKWAPPLQRGKVIEFCPQTKKSA